MAKKLGIIVPYRNRYDQLEMFKKHMEDYFANKKIKYHLYIVEQDDAKQFNRGSLLNIGFKYAKEDDCKYVVFHDVDMLPVDVDYSYSDVPLHLATNFVLEEGEKEREIFDEYFGGVTMFPMESFEKINGYSNKYWGWGYEDTDLLLRCVKNEVELDTLKLKNLGRKGQSLKFNGIDAYVECNNTFNFRNSSTIFISFYPEKLILDHTKESDEFTVFSIPGYDFAICFNSFSRYNFCAFDDKLNALYVNSKIKPNYKTNMVITIDALDNIFKVYQDGIFIGSTTPFKKLYKYKEQKKFYLGVGNLNREITTNYFKGTIDSFAYYDILLSDKEISEISHTVLDLKNYKSGEFLKIYYDVNNIVEYELEDLSGNNNNGIIVNCEMIDENYDEFTNVKIPYRRPSIFKSLKHEENGFFNNKWKDKATRWNQLRYYNEVSVNDDLLKNDGLSDLEFIEYGKITTNNITHINIGI